ncbi:unnamed protein product [Microthlaspi erraticum]|uniref:BTB domain-containing protein n=1 Tax=Microthlaspi erraticum TaxID=1685480 RepID=A0A6D2JGL5_9BRAS|nr:unnamed protein product [Microthlaspi erraticum]
MEEASTSTLWKPTVVRKTMAKQLTGKEEDLREVLQKQNQCGETALYVAAEYGDTEVVSELRPKLGMGSILFTPEQWIGGRDNESTLSDSETRLLQWRLLLHFCGKGKHKVHSHFDPAVLIPLSPYTLKYRRSIWGYKRSFRRKMLEEYDFLKNDCLKINCTVGVVVSEIHCPRLHSFHVRAHRLVLAARSPVFESEFDGVEEDRDIEALLHYIYKDALIEDAESSSFSLLRLPSPLY